tara:strand:- start:82 stop:279 length:198 start_codon:yes stop_codon:yes gene_type:complete
MVDITKYKNVSLAIGRYNTISDLRYTMVPNAIISRTQVLNILIEERLEKMKEEKERKKQNGRMEK